jgi:cytidine deaminase
MERVNDEQIEEALRVARAARERAYVPYSGFRMGAAVVTERGHVVPGALVENVSLGLAMCAERIALFATIAQDTGAPRVLVLVAPRTSGLLTRPCGACLQVALELGGPGLEIVMADTRDGEIERTTLDTLAPKLPYKPESFGKHLATAVKTSLNEMKP